MTSITKEFIISVLKEYGVQVVPDSSFVEGIQAYIALLLRWNRSISLTTVTDPSEIVRFHFGESMFAASIAGIRKGALADVGSGAGFPGLALKLLVPELELTLIESNARKGAFLSDVVRELGLVNVRVERCRMEEIHSGQFDFVTARALGHFEDLLAWGRRNLTSGGKVILWIGEEDLKSVAETPGWQWEPQARIPGSRRRFILVGSSAG
ncbi:MAG TPA: 16S rRNA (guanine(527)-N(7))-methyltransferase RsmG [Candidatus Aquilonibacter sp.]|nr:16S rRNA (guanine(527)-N(7))-methyltransferase RsmG [Candidatus Aquilonibacter sp.]